MKRYIKTPLKYALPLLFIGALVLVSISGCTSPTNSNQAASSASTTTSPTTSASASASVTPSNTASATPSADVYQVVVSGPTDGQYGAMWTATIYKNGVVIPCDQLTGQVSWYINGQPSNGGTFGGNQCTMTHDANGLDGSPFQHTNTITATYQGVTSSPISYTDTEIGQPTVTQATPTPAPVATPTPTPTPQPVQQQLTEVLISGVPVTVQQGHGFTISFQVVSDGKPIPSATVTFSTLSNGVVGTGVADSSGQGYLTLNTVGWPLGSVGGYADYAGNSQYSPARDGWGTTIVA